MVDTVFSRIERVLTMRAIVTPPPSVRPAIRFLSSLAGDLENPYSSTVMTHICETHRCVFVWNLSDSLELCGNVDACRDHLWLMAGYHVYAAVHNATCLLKCGVLRKKCRQIRTPCSIRI